ncbi:amino acid adenylation domain-containing protein [Nocardia sp. NBC_01503]|uniref:amino acid adenylation domain-containing protein n=1 Tax=Nocardia sp. NBC_01503 TaxID=2975997 RepID=UPI002E7B2AF3|nr:amino acid adenylation domain-containing protein [Nocardia sp. NBC_01503]WTL34885.1 amino acid adenylation domain-containing protein [Nocardia sp. NBC_01503]
MSEIRRGLNEYAGTPPGGEYRELTGYQQDVVAIGARYPALAVVQGAICLRFAGAPDISRLRECVERVQWRHDALRLRFAQRGDEFVQWVADAVAGLEVVECADGSGEFTEWTTRATATVLPVDGPLVRFAAVLDGPEWGLFYQYHHAAADGWAANLLLAQVCADYFDGIGGAAEAPSYLTFVDRWSEYRGSTRWVEDRTALWNRMSGLEPALFPRSGSLRDRRRHRHTLRIERAAMDRVRATGRTVFTVVSAAIAAYLHRVHRGGDMVLGVALLNRASREELRMIGDLGNILPLHVPVDDTLPLLRVADQVAAEVRELQRRQRYPFGALLTALRAQAGAMPTLFDVTLSYNRIQSDGASDSRVLAETLLSTGYSLDAVNVAIRDYAALGHVEVDLFYAEDVFDQDFRIEAAAAHVLRLIDASLTEPEAPLRAVDVLSARERALLDSFERPYPVEFDRRITLDRLTARQVVSTPGARALAWTDAEGRGVDWSYAEFAARVAAVAARLRAGGVRAQEFVPVLLPRSPELLVAVHGILAAGCAYVPIDPRLPRARIATMLSDCGARFAVGDPDGTVFPGVELIDCAVRGEFGPHESTSAPEDLAYLIYTSGSSGTPKGVMIEHRSVVNRLAWMQRRYPLTADDVILHKTPASFDVSVWELLWWSQTGASVALLPDGAERDPRAIVTAIERHAVTVLHFVPSMLGPFLAELESSGSVPATLRLLFCSGEALAPALVRRFGELCAAAGRPDVLLVNLYGPTEATVDVSWFDITVATARTLRRVPIGRPIDNIALSVLSADGGRCPVGVPGELNIAGVGVGRGYHSRPELTAAAFVTDDSSPGGRRYRTGDLARWLADGTVEYLGRLDDQVKVRGNRVTLGEVTDHLIECPGVETGVVVDEARNGSSTLIACYTGTAVPGVVADFLASRLPAYMVPSEFVPLAEIPLTPSGKADRRALRRLRRERTLTAGAGSAPPRGAIELALAAAWQEVLGGESPGRHDDFFIVGGDSILALGVRTAAERRGLHLDIDAFFAKPTIAELATTIGAPGELRAPAPFALVPLLDRASLTDAEDAFPAGTLALGMLFHSLERADSAQYHDVFRYRVAMPWREREFRAAYARLVRRHPALRSCFDLTGRSIPLQLVHREVPVELEVAEGDTGIGDYVDRMRCARYDFGSAPLHRLRAYVCSDEVELVFSFHHAILDGWSVAGLIGELIADYLDRHRPERYPSSILAEHIRAENQARQDPAAKRFWMELLADAPPAIIESGRAFQAPEPIDAATTVAAVPDRLYECATALARRRRVPVKSVLLTAHCLTLRELAGVDDVTTGIVTHARPGVDGGDRCAGLFLNTVPLRLRRTEGSWFDLVGEVAGQERRQHRHRRYPMRSMVADHGGPIFDTVFNYVDYQRITGQFEAATIELRDFAAHEETNFALLVSAIVDPRDGSLGLHIGSARDALTRAQREHYARRFVAILTAMVHAPDAPADLPAPIAADVASAVESTACAHPARPAVIAPDGVSSWTYRMLTRTADRLAHSLIEAGVRPGDRVAVQLERSAELIAVVLGVLRAGAAVVPLDPAYPQARRVAMLAVAQPRLVLAERADFAAAFEIRDPAELLAVVPSGPPLPLPAIRPGDIAYVLFTSGSTGEPKGVAMPHRGLANLVDWQNRRTSGAVGQVTAQFAPLGFDVAFQEIFATLIGGGTLRLLSEQQRRDPVALLSVIRESGVRRLFLPFVALQALAEAFVASGASATGLTTVISSGEQLRVTGEIRALCAADPGMVLENQYGPTETHVALAEPLIVAAQEFPRLPAIGAPIAGTRVQLLDDRLRPVRPGMVGEIYVAGACLAQGYERRPGLTAQRFVADAGGALRYRTGDLGVALPDGRLRWLGRGDTQVKVRGFRVECAEVEHALRSVPAGAGLREVAVVALPRGGADSVLAAFVTGDLDGSASGQVLGQVRSILPAHLVPTRLYRLDTLPRTPSGKRDDAALRALAGDAVRTGTPVTSGRAPADAEERALAAVLAECAGSAEFAADTDFFDAGGTSIGAMRVMLTITRRWGLTVPLETFIAAPTAAALAAIVRAGDTPAVFDPVVPLRIEGSGAPLFLVHPIGGSVLCYLDLVRRLPTGRPVYGLRAAGVDPGTEPLAGVEALAASYLAAVRRIQPEGPYLLAGWSFGGYVAFEMARQLPAACEVRVALLDTMILDDNRAAPVAERDRIAWFFGELLWHADGEVTGLDPTAATDAELFDTLLAQTIAAGIIAEDGAAQLIRRLYAVFCANFDAMVGYRPVPLDRDLLLLRARGEMPAELAAVHRQTGSSFHDPGNGWRPLTRDTFEVVEIPGDHLSMMRPPNVGAVAALLDRALDRVPVKGQHI